MTRKIDMEKLCPELAEPMKEVTEVMLHFATSPAWQRARNLDELLDKTELTLTFKEVQTIAATMLKLAEENEREYHKGYDDGVTGRKRRTP
jgi:hypothetical protein